jgi:DNA invertase Pin-like site-specific DNA recombinase
MQMRSKAKTTPQPEVSRITGVYCRVSPESTGSLTEQERQGIAEASARREGHWAYMDLRDGYSLDRPGLKSLKAEIERGKITRVWVADLTRLSRDPAELESITTYLAFHKVELAVVG